MNDSIREQAQQVGIVAVVLKTRASELPRTIRTLLELEDDNA